MKAWSDNKFLSDLVDETYRVLGKDGVDQSKDALMKRFNEKKSSETEKLELTGAIREHFASYSRNCLKLKYISKFHVYRLYFGNKVIDFPSNWSIFKLLDLSETSLQIIKKEDGHGLDEILKAFFQGDDESFAFIKIQGEVHLISGVGGELFFHKLKKSWGELQEYLRGEDSLNVAA